MLYSQISYQILFSLYTNFCIRYVDSGWLNRKEKNTRMSIETKYITECSQSTIVFIEFNYVKARLGGRQPRRFHNTSWARTVETFMIPDNAIGTFWLTSTTSRRRFRVILETEVTSWGFGNWLLRNRRQPLQYFSIPWGGEYHIQSHPSNAQQCIFVRVQNMSNENSLALKVLPLLPYSNLDDTGIYCTFIATSNVKLEHSDCTPVMI